MEIQSSRRQQAHTSLGLTSNVEIQKVNQALVKEEKRLEKKQQKRDDLESSLSYTSVRWISKVFDDYFLDPIIGFLPGIGDALTSFLALPFLYISLFKVKSIPLTLAVLNIVLIDVLIGMIPFLGNFADIFHKGFKKNRKLIFGFIEDDAEIIKEVNRKALWMTISIAIIAYLIYLVVKFVGFVFTWGENLIMSLFG